MSQAQVSAFASELPTFTQLTKLSMHIYVEKCGSNLTFPSIELPNLQELAWTDVYDRGHAWDLLRSFDAPALNKLQLHSPHYGPMQEKLAACIRHFTTVQNLLFKCRPISDASKAIQDLFPSLKPPVQIPFADPQPSSSANYKLAFEPPEQLQIVGSWPLKVERPMLARRVPTLSFMKRAHQGSFGVRRRLPVYDTYS